MYMCANCKVKVGPRVKASVVTTFRKYTHPYRVKAMKRVVLEMSAGVLKKKVKWQDDIGGVGPQIVTEIKVCAKCKEALTAPTAAK